mgnify:CR=1 FL=1
MVIAETLAGIALVKSAVDGIKSAIGTARDVSEIAHQIDNLFEGEKQIQRDKRKANDPFSVKSVAEETINAKLAHEQMDEMRQLIDMRFGHGTWQGIIAERARRIQEQKEAIARQKKEARERKEQMVKDAQSAFIIFGAVVGMAGIVFGLWVFSK